MHAHAGTAVATRFGERGFRLRAADATVIEACGGDELLFDDGEAHGNPYLCLRTAPCSAARFVYSGELLDPPAIAPDLFGTPLGIASALALSVPADRVHALEVAQWAAIAPWFADNALVHYLAPRGLEQFTGGGWGSRDICQGPLELLLARGHLAPARDLLLRVFGAQNEAGDWPQDNNPLCNAPHTVEDLVSDWDRPYTRKEGCFPAGSFRVDKYWSPVNRVDNVYGDRHLICTCPPLEDYIEAAE